MAQFPRYAVFWSSYCQIQGYNNTGCKYVGRYGTMYCLRWIDESLPSTAAHSGSI